MRATPTALSRSWRTPRTSERPSCSGRPAQGSPRSRTPWSVRNGRPRARSAPATRKGRHTTVARELVPLASGGVLIDTPGLRALGLTASDEGIGAVFSEIDELAQHCRFRDCAHADEPGCAVKAAVMSGTLPADRLASYHKLMRESAVAAARDDVRLRSEVKGRSKTIAKAIKD